MRGFWKNSRQFYTTWREFSAINSTVYKAEAEQVLAIQVNGNQSVTVEELEAAGYTVSFSANKAVFAGGAASTTSTTGKLISDLGSITEFNYSVTVTKGEDSFTSATTGKVTVVDASAIKSIDELELQKRRCTKEHYCNFR